MNIYLYRCETDDQDENWIIVASSAEDACHIHESGEGYDDGDTEAYCICPIPESLNPQPG